ncbi:hypothetical protein QOZ80_7AG0580510 [Eleusine coracana subsp. coracana]|nr:hypothetical protein QOZ80_7AG0580510 [Eleusine coracana subsp. coracana]
MPGSSGGGGAAKPRPPASGRGRRQHQHATSLPFDVMVDIAACSDPATLVRFAATCREARSRVAEDPAASGSGTPPTGLSSAPLASRDGLLLLREAKGELRVCEPATGHSQILPPQPTFPTNTNNRNYHHPLQYVLLLGVDTDNASSAAAAGSIIGRPFQLLLARLEVSHHRRHLQIQTFSSSSEDLDAGAWGAFTEIRIPNLYGTRLKQDLGRHLVVGGAVHWLCLTDAGSYVIKPHVKSAQVTMISELPETFPCDRWQIQHLLATTSPGGNPVVLVNDDGKVSACEYYKVRLHWFAERSGVVLVEIEHCGFFWVELRSMEIVRWFWDPLIEYATVCCPYEIDLSSWVPTFSSTI